MIVEDIFSSLPVLETERLLLRKLTIEDADALFYYASNPEVTKYVLWKTHQNIRDSKAFIQYALQQYQHGELAPWGIEYKETKKLIGTIDFVQWDINYHAAEIGYVLSKDYWRKGIMTEAATEVLKFGFNQMQLVRIQAKCIVQNVPSVGVMEKIGMSFEGIKRKGIRAKEEFHDVSIYAITDDDWKRK